MSGAYSLPFVMRHEQKNTGTSRLAAFIPIAPVASGDYTPEEYAKVLVSSLTWHFLVSRHFSWTKLGIPELRVESVPSDPRKAHYINFTAASNLDHVRWTRHIAGRVQRVASACAAEWTCLQSAACRSRGLFEQCRRVSYARFEFCRFSSNVQ